MSLDTAAEDNFDQCDDRVDTILAKDIESLEVTVAKRLVTYTLSAENHSGRSTSIPGTSARPLGTKIAQ